MVPDDIDPILLVRYFSGEGSEADVQAVRRWIAADPAHAAVVEGLREAWRIAGEAQPEWDVEEALAAVRARGATRVGDVVPLASRRTRPANLTLLRPAPARWRVMATRIAAGIAIVAGAGLVWRAAGPGAVDTAPVVAMRTFTTANAEQATVALSDGSRVILGPASTLRVPERFGPDGRNVSLDGEAYFEVAHDTTRPFTVASGIGLTRVLGTKFGVRARAEDGEVRVVVAEGRVSLAPRDTTGGAGGAPVILAAGDLGRLAPNGAPEAVRQVDVTRYLGWTEGRLVFVDAPLPEVLAELNRWYDVEFRLGDPALARRHLTTSFQHETIAQVLDVLRASLDVRGIEAGRTVTLYPSRP